MMSTTTTTRKPFRERPLYLQVLTAVVAPAVLGAIAGLLLGISAPVYWVISVIAAIGGFVAGFDHLDWRGALLRGLVGGVLYGVLLLLIHLASGLPAKVSLGGFPPLLIVITAILGILLALAGTFVGQARGRTTGRRAKNL